MTMICKIINVSLFDEHVCMVRTLCVQVNGKVGPIQIDFDCRLKVVLEHRLFPHTYIQGTNTLGHFTFCYPMKYSEAEYERALTLSKNPVRAG
jgi:hypothetical protein